MKTVFAYEKSEYSRALINFLNLELSRKERMENYSRMKELEKIVTKAGDEIIIIIATHNTPKPLQVAPPMKLSS